MVGCPSRQDYSTIVEHKIIPHLPVSPLDVRIGQAIYDQELGTIQGKIFRRQPPRLPHDYMSVPKSILTFFRDIILYGDILHKNTSPIFITTSSPVYFIIGELLKDCKALTLCAALLCVGKLFQCCGFNIQMCYLDNQFEPVIPVINKRSDRFPIKKYSAEEHVNKIKRCIRTIKEQDRCIITTLWFKRISQIILICSIIFTILWLSFLPPRNVHLSLFLVGVQMQRVIARLHSDSTVKCLS